MHFKIDENLPVEVAELLQQAQHNAATVSNQQLSGEPDSKIAAVCQAEQRALITLDTDFSDIRTYPPAEYAGIIVLRLKQQDKASVLAVITRLVAVLAQETLVGQLWIVDEQRVRVRGE